MENGRMMNEPANGRTGSLMDGWMDGWMDGSLNKWMNDSNGKKKKLEINFYKLYGQVACYADVLRGSFSLGKERMTKLLNWRLRGSKANEQG